MVIIVVGVVVSLILLIFFPWWAVLAFVLLCVIVTFFPLEGYRGKLCEGTIDLVSLKRQNENEKSYFVELKGKRAIYAYDNSLEYGLSGDAYEQDCVRGNIKIYESKKCNKPILRKFVTKPKRDLFATAPFANIVEYVFYIPEGTVLKKGEMQKTTVDLV